MKDIQTGVGVDIGGSHITAGLVDLAQRKIIPGSVSRAPINAGDEASNIINAWADCIATAADHRPLQQVWLAMPGPFNYQEGISLMQGQNKYEKLYGLNIRSKLAAALRLNTGDIFLDNDAACFVQGEVFGGNATQYNNDVVIGVTLGTGLGSAVYKNGSARSADLWSLPFRDSIAEDYLSTRWFVKRFNEMSGQEVRGVNEIAQQATTNANARNIFKEFGNSLAEFLLIFIELEKPKVVLLGGNIAKAYTLFGDDVDKIVSKRFPQVAIQLSSLGEEASLLGAAGSWYRRQLDPVS